MNVCDVCVMLDDTAYLQPRDAELPSDTHVLAVDNAERRCNHTHDHPHGGGHAWGCISIPDDKLFQSVLYNPEHTLYQLLPDRRHDITYSLRPRRHDLTLSRGSHCIYDCNFIIRLLFKDSY